MRTIAHLSDLHFGAEEPALVEALLAELGAVNPTLVVVSGDLTQRARRRQFTAARAFLERIPSPTLVVPGNHDIPLYDLWRRFLRPLRRYRRYITNDLAPWFQDEELAVLGLNTARSSTWRNGRISIMQMEAIRSHFDEAPLSVFKVLVTHHPFLPPPDAPTMALVGRGVQALQAAAASDVDLVLAGHVHRGYTGDVRAHHLPLLRRSILVAQAGTALSYRRRDDANSYNFITVSPPRLSLEARAWDGQGFVVALQP